MGYIGGKLHPWFGAEPVDKFLRNAVVIVAAEGSAIAAKETPVDTGDLAEAWEHDRIGKKTAGFQGFGYRASWMNDTDYAIHVNYGTGLYGPEHKKYLIKPKRPGGSLHWVDSLTGVDVYRNSVMHPGSPGHYMLETSATVVEAKWPGLIRPALKNWAKNMERQNPYALR
jgi:hypothetical protein